MGAGIHPAQKLTTGFRAEFHIILALIIPLHLTLEGSYAHHYTTYATTLHWILAKRLGTINRVHLNQ